jgi:hypothetical protein
MEQNRAASRGAEQLASLTRQLDALTSGPMPSVVGVPELPANAQGIEALQRIADVLGDARVSA